MWIHDETLDISKFTHSQGMGFIPPEILPPPEQPPTPVAVAARRVSKAPSPIAAETPRRVSKETV